MRMFLSVLLLGLLAGQAALGEITVEKVFGPELPCKYKHPACVEEFSNGDLYISYYGGSGEYDLDTAVYGSRLKKGESEWSTPVPIADTPFHSDGNPVVWEAPDGVVWLFHVVRYGETWSDSRIHVKISKDKAQTWSDSFVLADDRGMMVRSQPILLNDGDYLLPIYHETGHDTEAVGADTASLFLRCDPKTMTWTETNRIYSRMGNLQASVVQIDDDYLIAYMRRGGDYEPREDGWMVRSESRDGGRTWAAGTETSFPNPNAAIDFIKLQSGSLLLVYNDNMNDRTPLTVSISKDNGKTWPYKKNIAVGDFDYAYPYAIQARDGKIHLIYTSHSRSHVNRAVFEEKDITGE